MTTSQEVEFAPELPPHGPVVWLRENLFQNGMSGVMSVISVLVVVVAVRGLLAWMFNPRRRWDAVTFNMKLMMVMAYPADQLWRVWLSVFVVIALVSASLAVWKVGGKAEPRHVGRTFMTIGGTLVFIALVSPFSTSGKGLWAGAGALFFIVGWTLRTRLGERAKKPLIPVLGLVTVAFGLIIVALWTVKVPWPLKEGDFQIIVFEPIAMSTRIPWTMLFFGGIVAYLAVKVFAKSRDGRRIRASLTGLWVLSFPTVVFILLRNPQVDVNRGVTWYLPTFIGFSVIGWFVLTAVSKNAKNELGRVIAGVLLIAAVTSFVFPMEFLIRFLLMALAAFAFLTPTFGGVGPNQRKLLYAWVFSAGTIVLSVWLTLNASGIDVPGESYLGGLMLTIVLAVLAVVLSIPIGILMALGRTSTMPIFRLLSTVYIELVRGVPLITWLLIAFIMLPVAMPDGVTLSGVMKAVGAMTFFNGAYLAENIRGGLQSISVGQKEASRALGMSTIQETVFITLPQAIRAVLPALVGQVIATFKDTSLVTIVSLFDFLHIARVVIPSQSNPFVFKGSITVTLVFAAFVYWLFTFAFSRMSLRIEKKLGVGER